MVLRVGDVRSGAADMQFTLLHRTRADEKLQSTEDVRCDITDDCRIRTALTSITRCMHIQTGYHQIRSNVRYNVRERPDIDSDDPAGWYCLEVDIPHPAKLYLEGCETMTAYPTSFLVSHDREKACMPRRPWHCRIASFTV